MQKKLFNVFFYLFFIFMINRELTPLGIDLRIIGVILGVVLIFIKICENKKKKNKLTFTKIDFMILSFFAFCFFSNIMWLFNDLVIDVKQFLVIVASYIGNLIFYLTFKLYSENITLNKFNKAMKISILILIFSILVILLGVDIRTILLTDCKGFVKDLSSNFLGGMYRYGGFSEDPNYASLFFVFAMATEIYSAKKSNIKFNYMYLLISLIGLMLSASKTTLVAIIPAMIMLCIKPSKFKTLVNYISIPFVVLIPILFVMIKIDLFDSIITMMQRIKMWNFSMEIFVKSPIIGNGFTAFRSYLEARGWWYVQCHSTIFQMLSETGIISLILFVIILCSSLLKNNKFLTFITTLFSIFMITTETAYHVYFIYVLAILPIIICECDKNKTNKKKATVFVVNSLSNGGAERVVANLANKMAEMGKNVYIYILNNKVTYNVNEAINVISLYKKEISNIKKPFFIPYLSYKLTNELNKLEKEFEIELYTSHLKFSNYVSRFSKYTKKCIYVMHIPFSPYGKGFLYENRIKFIYNNQKIMTVSKGVENEIIEKYKIKPKKIATIYNPIDVEEISKKSVENIELPFENYILFCGRLNYQKRPLMAIDIFYKNELYKKYNLVMLGQGELKEEIEKRIKEYNIKDKVHLLGWSSNPYAYMKNSLMLMNCSAFEAFPMTMIEAFACNCKVVSFDIKYGPNEILVDDLSIYLVEDQNIKEMGQKINLAIKKYPKKLKEQVEKYQTENIVKNYYTISKKWSEK